MSLNTLDSVPQDPVQDQDQETIAIAVAHLQIKSMHRNTLASLVIHTKVSNIKHLLPII